jgi:hypothetical protein
MEVHGCKYIQLIQAMKGIYSGAGKAVVVIPRNSIFLRA